MHTRRHKPRPIVWVAGLCALLAAAPGCKKRAPKSVHVPQMAQGFDGAAIDSAALSTDAQSRHHVLNMGAPELAHRLGSFALRSQTTITLTGPDGRQLGQKVHSGLWVRDGAGNIHLQAGNADHQFELIAAADRAYVRQDKGHMRRKRRQEVDEVEMAEATASSLRELLQHFAGATLVHGAHATWEGREAVRYEVELGEDRATGAPPQPSLLLLPVAAPSRWREEAKHPRLTGKVVVDGATGAVVKADVTGAMSVTGATGQPLTLTLRCVHTLSEIGAVDPVREPAQSMGEVRRPLRPRDPLSFFREAQKGRAAQGPGAGKQAPAGQGPSGDGPDDGLSPPSEDLPEEEGTD